jgi:hypothetical protein
VEGSSSRPRTRASSRRDEVYRQLRWRNGVPARAWDTSAGTINERGEFFAPEKVGPVRIRVTYLGVAASTDLTVIPNDDIFDLTVAPATIEVQAGGFATPVLRAVNRQGMVFYPRANWTAVRGRIEALNTNLAPARALEDEATDYRVTQTLTPQRVIYSTRSPAPTPSAVIPGVREAVCLVEVVQAPSRRFASSRCHRRPGGV